MFNWYTVDRTPSFIFDGPREIIRQLSWFENDLGFTTCAQDGNVYFWDLYNNQVEKKQEELKRRQEDELHSKGVLFTGVVNVPNRPF